MLKETAMTLARATVWTFVLLGCMTGQLEAQAPADEPIYDLVPNKNVSEELYLVRRLETLHSIFASSESNADQLAADLFATRFEMARIEEYARAKFMDDRLIQLYGDSIQLLDQYSNVLMDMGAIDREFERELGKHGVESVTRGVADGLQATGGLTAVGADPWAGAVVIAGMAAEKSYSVYQERQCLRQENEYTKTRRYHGFEVERARLLGRIQVQVGVLAEKRKWLPTEVGFDSTPEDERKWLLALDREDYTAIRTHFEALQKLRPRDPFVLFNIAEMGQVEAALVSDDAGDAARIPILKQSLRNYIRAAELVPADRFHDSQRAGLLSQASDVASTILCRSGKQHSLPLQLANAALRCDPRDATGDIKCCRVIALLRNGDYASAIAALDQLAQLHGRDADYHIYMARILSLSHRPKEAFEHIRRAWALGQRDVRALKSHPDLAKVYTECREDFEGLVRPTWNSNIDYGYVWNDFKLENHSEYPLTSLAAKATWDDGNGNTLVEVYWFESVGSQEKKSISWGFSNAADNSEQPPQLAAEILCDQTRSIEPTPINVAEGHYQGHATYASADSTRVHDTLETQLVVESTDTDELTAVFTSSAGKIELQVDVIRDSFARLRHGDDAKVVGGIWFSQGVAYGWFTSPHSEDGRRCVYWLDKATERNAD
jgi:tetratricopeptide (TPR) repeat protein